MSLHGKYTTPWTPSSGHEGGHHPHPHGRLRAGCTGKMDSTTRAPVYRPRHQVALNGNSEVTITCGSASISLKSDGTIESRANGQDRNASNNAAFSPPEPRSTGQDHLARGMHEISGHSSRWLAVRSFRTDAGSRRVLFGQRRSLLLVSGRPASICRCVHLNGTSRAIRPRLLDVMDPVENPASM